MNDRTKFYRTICASLGLLIPLVAAEAQTSVSENQANLPIGGSELLNVGGGLIFVVLAIIVLGIVYARTQGLRVGSNGVINVIATQALGPKERIAIIEIADQQLLIGMTTASVQTLHVFEQPVVVAEDASIGFSDRLKNFMRGEDE